MDRPLVHIRWQTRSRGGKQYADLRWTEDGVRCRKTLGYTTVAEAERERAAAELRLRAGQRVSQPSSSTGSPLTVADLVVAYLEALEQQRRGTERYRRHELLHCTRIGQHLGDVVADRVGEAHIRRLVAGVLAETPPPPREGEAPLRGLRRRSSVLDLVGCLRRVYRHARDVGLADHSLPRLPRQLVPDDARPPRRLTEADVRLLATTAGEDYPWFGRLVTFLAWCPRRPVALFALRRKDCVRALDETLPRAQRQLYVSRDKAGVGRGWCPLTEPALGALVAQLESTPDDSPDALVWTSARGRPLDAALLAGPLHRAALLAGLEDVRVYDLRKFGATTVYQHVHDLNQVALYTGHRDVRTLFRYLSAPRGAAEAAAGTIGWSDEGEL